MAADHAAPRMPALPPLRLALPLTQPAATPARYFGPSAINGSHRRALNPYSGGPLKIGSDCYSAGTTCGYAERMSRFLG
jgi:hypothetical protein